MGLSTAYHPGLAFSCSTTSSRRDWGAGLDQHLEVKIPPASIQESGKAPRTITSSLAGTLQWQQAAQAAPFPRLDHNTCAGKRQSTKTRDSEVPHSSYHPASNSYFPSPVDPRPCSTRIPSTQHAPSPQTSQRQPHPIYANHLPFHFNKPSKGTHTTPPKSPSQPKPRTPTMSFRDKLGDEIRAKQAAAKAEEEARGQQHRLPRYVSENTRRPKHTCPPMHDQFIQDPLGHFLGIPWAAAALTDPAALEIAVSDRTRLPSGDMLFVRSVMNGARTVRACVTYWVRVPPPGLLGAEAGLRPLSMSAEMLRRGGRENGETRDRPFLLFNVLLDLGEDLCGFKGTLHGGALGVFLDETMCAAADNQSRELLCFLVIYSRLGPMLTWGDGRVCGYGDHDDQLPQAGQVAEYCRCPSQGCQEGRAQDLGPGGD